MGRVPFVPRSPVTATTWMRAFVLLCAGFGVAAGACSDATGGNPPVEAPPRIELAAAVADSALVGQSLGSVAVKVTSASGAPLPNVAVDFAVTAGQGTVSGARALTDAGGVATVAWTAGPAPGPNEVQARLADHPAVAVIAASKAVLARPTITAGYAHTCGLNAQGRAFCWGRDYYGQLGNGSSTANPRVPGAVEGGLAFWSIDAGHEHTCAIASTGRAYCWGLGAQGQLGNGQTEPEAAPAAVSGTTLFAAISAGMVHTCALSTTGQAWCWGRGTSGQLGNGSAGSTLGPVAVAGGHTFAAISAGVTHTCALTGSGTLYCWGSNSVGQLGTGNTASALAPAPVPGRTFRSVSAGAYHTCAEGTDGKAYCWGANNIGQLGTAETQDPCSSTAAFPCATSPAPIAEPSSFGVIDAATDHSCGLVANGAAYCWGSNFRATLGDGSTQHSRVPVAVSGARAYAGIAAGHLHSCAVTAAYQVFCWGENGGGQIGDGSTEMRLVPTSIAGGSL